MEFGSWNSGLDHRYVCEVLVRPAYESAKISVYLGQTRDLEFLEFAGEVGGGGRTSEDQPVFTSLPCDVGTVTRQDH